MVIVAKSADSEGGKLFIAAVDRVCVSEGGENERVAFDCEGVSLSRLGSVELVSVYFASSSEVFLVDLGGKVDAEILKAVKDLMEDSNVVKVIHDSRMDSDSLFHLHGISLKSIHDTSCFHAQITGREDVNLNDTLQYYGISPNDIRDKNVYRFNPAFWATRPLTSKMIEWAASDVDRLVDVATKQLDRIGESDRVRALRLSQEYVKSARDMKVIQGLRVTINIGRFIGKRGANLRSLQRRTGTLIYQDHEEQTWFVYYPSRDALDQVKLAMTNGY